MFRKKTTAKKKRKRAIAFLDASVLDQVVEEEQQEKTQQDASTVQQQQQTIQTDKVTIVSQDQKPTIIKHFEEYKVKVRVLGKSNLYSAPQSIDPKITTFLQQHFYGGRIRRENTLHWHGEKRKKKKMAQPALQFAL